MTSDSHRGEGLERVPCDSHPAITRRGRGGRSLSVVTEVQRDGGVRVAIITRDDVLGVAAEVTHDIGANRTVGRAADSLGVLADGPLALRRRNAKADSVGAVM